MNIYIIEWYDSYQDEDNDGNLRWFDNLSSRHIESFFEEDKFISKLRKLQDLHVTKEPYCIKNCAVGTIKQYFGNVSESRY